MLIFLPPLLALLLPFVLLLAVYEAVRGIVALKKGNEFSVVAIDFIAAAIMCVVAGAILYLFHGHPVHWSF